ncbi:MAG: Nicotinamide-nucleotide adenylyltransferase [Candidatus Heimdallarchaeota archaeon LC_3]|nr:MAG: Nicotinamide-nucleotide adenylyltransferase [Candidatus Heimdallarchaeota archaeon LC_3]
MKEKFGVIFGRFQPFHNGHLEHVLTPLHECDFLYIGITNPDNKLMQYDESDSNRSLKSSNPYSYFHRHEMIKNTLLDLNISLSRFDIIPFPINYPGLILNYSPKEAIYYITVLTTDRNNNWNYKKKEILASLNLKTKIIKNKRLTSSSEIRKRMREAKNWADLVPNTVYNYILKNNLILRDDENE